MFWQDIVIAVGQWLFVLALLPSIFSKDKPALLTSVMTGMILSAFSIAYWTIGLEISSFSTAVVSIEWFILAYQKYKQKQKIPE